MFKIGKSVGVHAVGEVGSRIPLTIVELLFAKALGPVQYGLWSIVQTIVAHGNFLHLGAVSSLSRKEPSLRVANDLDSIRKMRAATYGFQYGFSALIFALICGFVFFSSEENRPAITSLLPAVIVTVALQQVLMTSQSCVINEQKFVAQSASRLLYGIVFLLVGVSLISLCAPGVKLVILAWDVALLSAIAMLFWATPSIRILPRIDLATTVYLIRDGSPILLQGLMRTSMSNLDRIIIWILADGFSLGIYALGALGGTTCLLLGSLVSRISLPDFLQSRARGDENGVLSSKLENVFSLGSALGFCGALGICCFTPAILGVFIPSYGGHEVVFAALGMAGATASISQIAADISLSLGYKKRVIGTTFVCLLALGMVVSSVWSLTLRIEFVAIATVPLLFVYALVMVGLTYNAIGFSRRESRLRIWRLASKCLVLYLIGAGLALMNIHLFEERESHQGRFICGMICSSGVMGAYLWVYVIGRFKNR